MNSVTPSVHMGARLVTIAKDQPQYETLVASKSPDGVLMTEWVLTPKEVEILLSGGRIRHWQHTFGEDMQPIQLEVIDPTEIPPES